MNNTSSVGATPGVTPQQAAAVSGSSSSGEIRGDTPIRTMEDLREKSPKLYDMTLQGIGMHIVSEMRQHQERIKELNQKARNDR